MSTQTSSSATPVSAYGPADLRMAALAYLARFRGVSPAHTESDLRAYLSWCADHGVRRLKPSTVGRRASVVMGFYRTCVIDGILEHSPADYV